MKKLLLVLLFLGLSFGATAVQMDFLMAGVMDSAGKPLSNGKVYFYVNNGGTTTKSIYTDATMSSVMSQPVALNSSGVPTNIPYGFGTYRVVWKTSAGVTIKTVTGVQYGQQATSANGIIDVGLTYGYNNAAVQAAIDAAGASDYTLVFSKGEYTIGTSKTFPSNVRVQFEQGAYWTISGGSVSVEGVIDALPNVFRGTGQVTVRSITTGREMVNPIIRRDWWMTKAAFFAPAQDTFTGTANYNFRQYYTDLSVGDVPVVGGPNQSGVLSVVGTVNISGEVSVMRVVTMSVSEGVTQNVSSDAFVQINSSGELITVAIFSGPTTANMSLACSGTGMYTSAGGNRDISISACVPRGWYWVWRAIAGTIGTPGNITERVTYLGK